MGKSTNISWCDSTINPVMGCDGCELHKAGAAESHCYAAGLVGRYAGLKGWPVSFDTPEFFAGRIEEACRWTDLTGTARKGDKHTEPKPWLNGLPRTIFLGDLADVFSESLPIDWLAPYLSAMAAAPHIWILLTKRPSRMGYFFGTHACPPNFWLMTTVTSEATIQRARNLASIPGVNVRGISIEPMLGQIEFAKHCLPIELFDWVICGGESGPGARPMNHDWVHSLRDQCEENVPFFFKQGSQANWGKDFRNGILDGREWREMPEVRR